MGMFAPEPLSPRTRRCYFDCETFPITPTNPTPRLVCFQYAFGDEPPGITTRRTDILEVFSSPETVFIAHNGFYDWSILLNENLVTHEWIWEAIQTGNIEDTLVLACLHAIEFDWMKSNPNDEWRPATFTLASLARTLPATPILLDKSEDSYRLRYGELAGTPVDEWPPEAVHYAKMDVVALRDVYKALRSEGWSSPDEANQTRAFWCLRLMEIWGAITSPVAVRRLRELIDPAREAAHEHLIRAGLMREGGRTLDSERLERAILAGYPSAPRTPTGRVSTARAITDRARIPPARDPVWLSPPGAPSKNMRAIQERVAAWYTARELPIPETEKGAISTERAVLEVVGADDGDMAVLAAIGAVEKVASTYLPFLERPELHPRWNGLVETGRVSVSNPNLNNLPRKLTVAGKDYSLVRECIVARPGYAFIDADYSQAELCALSQVTYEMFGRSTMRDVIISGRDIHTWVASILAGVSYEEQAAHGRKSLRTLAKALSFGLPGGLGPKKFVQFALDSYGVVLTVERARELKEMWLETFPEVREMFAWTNAQLAYAPHFTLTQIRSGRRRGGCRYCDGNNSLFQGLTADGAKRALALVTRECYLMPASPLYGSRIVAFIYDELLLETPEDRVGEAARRLEELMVEGMAWATPDVPVRVTMEAMYHWSKGSVEVRNDRGDLIPYDKRMV